MGVWHVCSAIQQRSNSMESGRKEPPTTEEEKRRKKKRKKGEEAPRKEYKWLSFPRESSRNYEGVVVFQGLHRLVP